MAARLGLLLFIAPFIVVSQQCSKDFGVAYNGRTIFTVNSANDTCACLNYFSSGPATFGSVVTESVTATNGNSTSAFAGPAVFGSDVSFGRRAVFGTPNSSCTTSLLDALVFRLDGSTGRDSGPYSIGTTGAVLCNQAVGVVSGVCLPNGVDSFALNASQAAGLFPAARQARTICSWGYLSALSGRQTMFAYGSAGLGTFVGAVGAAVTTGITGQDMSALTWSTGTWTHVCSVYDGADNRLYVNGDLALETRVPWNLASLVDRASVGAQPDGSEKWTGALYDVRVYARSLAGHEVHALYRATRGNSGDVCSYVTSDTSVVHKVLVVAGNVRTGSGSASTIAGRLTVTAPAEFHGAAVLAAPVAYEGEVRFDGPQVTSNADLLVNNTSSFAAPVSMSGGLTVTGGTLSAGPLTATTLNISGLATLGGVSIPAGRNVKVATSGSGVSSVQIGSASSASTLSVFGDIYQAYPGRFGLSSSNVCGSASQGGVLTLTCPANTVITAVAYSSFGNSTGSCPGPFSTGLCHAPASTTYLTAQCLGLNTCAFTVALNTPMGDPCPEIAVKVWRAIVSCGKWPSTLVDDMSAIEAKLAVSSSCPAGYAITGFAANYMPLCTDINECATNNGGCSPMSGTATCTNTPGSFVCSGCKPPYKSLTNGRCTGILAIQWPQWALYPDVSPQWLDTLTLGSTASSTLYNGQLTLTTNTASVTGLYIWTPPPNVRGQADFHAEWTMYIGGGTSPAGDGLAFIYGPDLPNSVSGVVACDTGTYSTNGGITVGFTTSTTNLIRTYSNNVQKSSVGQNPVCSWCKVTVDVVGGKITVVWNNINMANNVDLGTTYVPTSTWRFGFCARTGTSNANHQINNVLVY
eukprot:TRINITY_DN315_c0_g2_i1.p1 TRINITY_DN315_c0_g2~~TRINITY_DN315_c0_g2_i1.p1  ORF type:complete len:864 (+),score=256.15 TRINITY_DN315_c0_g2_i1:187-2778(+)